MKSDPICRGFSRATYLGLLNSEHGSAAIMVALSLTVLMGMAGLAIDVGQLRLAKQRLQMVADAAALAGALELSSCGTTANCSMLTSAAQSALTENGFTGSTLVKQCATASTTTLTVTVNNGPCTLGASNPHNGNKSYVEVVVSQPQATYFSGVLGINSVLIKTRAEAGLGSSPNCLYTLGTSGTDLLMNGSGTLTVQSCGIVDNSSDSQALLMHGSGQITAATIGVVGNYKKTGSGSLSPTPVTGIAPASDPLSDTTPPTFDPSSCSPTQNVSGSSPKSLGPDIQGGTVCYKGISITGSGAITFKPGLYIINGAFSLGGSGPLSGTGVTFYFPPGAGTYSDSGSGSISFAAPVTGPYDGILFYQNASNTSAITISGSPTSSLNGILYAPGADITLNGSGTSTIYLSLIVKSIQFNGSGTMNLINYGSINPTSPLISPAQLVQ